jgi:hypothetical protein
MALGGTASAIGITLMINHWTIAALIAFCVAFFLVAVGGIVELLVPFIMWEVKGFGKFDRAIKRRIKEAERMLKSTPLSYEDWRTWQHDTSIVLSNYLGGEWHPEVIRFQSSGAYNSPNQEYFRSADSGHRKTLTIQQLNALSDLRQSLRNKHATIVILDSNIKLS